ncbi:DUF4192 domain-containing protein [Mycobacterium sp. DBP42]|uniref:DUF4192 domain-containing protein n=1 Tax=Mycobacteriaceae TaxID=1762 RepID=UPI00110CB1DE|nr:DUF4192 domain-containing protein [Mycobacterium sp. DBP42]TMS50660.1 DUF4192 domain-containing protein [Mycobacterium sp. DBP42]
MKKVRMLGNLVCNIVAVLGFTPVESLVLVVIRAGGLDAVMRVDLCDAVADGAAGRLAELVACQDADADGAVAVIVSEEGVMRSACSEQLRGMVCEAASELERRGSQLFEVIVVDRIAAGGRWFCLDDSATGGVLDDPASSVLAAAVVAEGRRMFGCRAELEELVAVDNARLAAVAPLVGEAEPVEDVVAAVRLAVDAMRQTASGGQLPDVVLAGVGWSLGDVRVRDALFNMGGLEEMMAAEQLWTRLARVLPAPFRAEALTLLAMSCFLRGEGPVAGIALEAALAENPEHRMAGMLDTALQSGMRPEQLRGLIAGIRPAVSV